MNLTESDIKAYLIAVGKRGFGKRGVEIIAIINKLRPFIAKMQTELGQEFLIDDIQEHAELTNKIYECLVNGETIEPNDIVRLQDSHKRLQKIYNKLAKYEELTKEVKREGINAEKTN